MKFVSPPTQTYIPCPIHFDDSEMASIDEEIHTLLHKGAIIPVAPEPGQCISTIFTRPKKSGGLRTIINLKRLNHYLEKSHFTMEHIMTILPLIKQGMFMTSLDLTDAYFSLPIAERYKNISNLYGKASYMNISAFALDLALLRFTS